MTAILVAGGGGAIGGHLTRRLLDDGHEVKVADIKDYDEWWQTHEAAENWVLDLADLESCRRAVDGVEHVYMLAADMGGMGFIENHKAECMLSVLPSTHMLVAAHEAGVARYFYSSSACVYPAGKQDTADLIALAEDDAYPADPEDGYGWEKLFTERMCRHFREDYGLETRVARYHNVYGPHGTWEGGREKAPAAICRKVAEAKMSGDLEIEIWGDGEQTRSFMDVRDCVEGTMRLMASDTVEPLNIGTHEMVTINGLVSIVEDIAGVTLKRHYQHDAPQGVRGRNSDNTKIRQALGWEPSIPLREGMETLYAWVLGELRKY
jgi:GDP-D-mannose 3',5'-epimerase